MRRANVVSWENELEILAVWLSGTSAPIAIVIAVSAAQVDRVDDTMSIGLFDGQLCFFRSINQAANSRMTSVSVHGLRLVSDDSSG